MCDTLMSMLKPKTDQISTHICPKLSKCCNEIAVDACMIMYVQILNTGKLGCLVPG